MYDEDQGTSGPDLYTVKTHHTAQLIHKINLLVNKLLVWTLIPHHTLNVR